MDTIDEQLDAALAKNRELESLLADANARAASLETENATLEAANAELKDNLSLAKENLAKLEASNREAQEIIATLQAEAKSAEQKAAEIYGAQAGTPAAVTPKGDPARPLIERFLAITDPAQQTQFLRSLSDAERAELYANI